MSVESVPEKLRVGELAQRMRGEMVPLNNRFSYFSVGMSMSEDDVREYLEEPIAALPPAFCAELPKTAILLVPYLEKDNGKERGNGHGEDLVCFDRPPDNRITWSSQLRSGSDAVLVFALKEQEVSDYHYRFYHLLSGIAGDVWDADKQDQFFGLLREELSAGTHGEVDEESWHLKQALLRRQTKVRRRSKAFDAYARQSFVDTLTLYLHGICCDIDVDTGPRQLASRRLRRRLELLHSFYPPPAGYAVFPEGSNQS